ncbi:MAG TPA: hypothetical protein VGB30_00935 [bacterium]
MSLGLSAGNSTTLLLFFSIRRSPWLDTLKSTPLLPIRLKDAVIHVVVFAQSSALQSEAQFFLFWVRLLAGGSAGGSGLILAGELLVGAKIQLE